MSLNWLPEKKTAPNLTKEVFMKTILLTIFLLVPQVKAEEYSKAASDADTKLCQAFKELAKVSRRLKGQREIEAASGVRDMKFMRDQGALFVTRWDEFKAAIQKSQAAGGFVKNFQEDCTGITASDEAIANEEVSGYLERIGKGDVMKKAREK
jgi:hypothetical protein